MTAATWDPWSVVPVRCNLGVELTSAQVKAGRGERTALLWENAAGATTQLTFRQLDALSSRLASALAELGLQRGERVFLRLPIIPEFYIAALAVSKLGGVWLPTSTQFRESEVAYRLKDAGVAAVITSTHLVDVVDACRADCPDLRHVIVVPYPEPPAHPGDYVDYRRLIAAGRESFIPADTTGDQTAFIAYTSGTTGDPKGVVHAHRYAAGNEGLIRWWHCYRDDDVAACPSDLGWMLPVACTFLFSLRAGVTTFLYDPLGGRFDAERWFALFEKYRISNFTAPPTVFRMMMLAAEAARHHDLSAFRHAVTAGEPLPADTLTAIQRHFGVTPFDGLGMSECMVYCYNRPDVPLRPGSCGQTGPGLQLDLLDENLQPVPVGSEGVLCVNRTRHPGMMKEYWNKPAQTAEVFRGQWYWTGDVLTRDADGYYWFQGRADDVMKCSGYRISPFEVESALLAHPAVAEAAAVEAPDPIRGNVIKAYLVLRAGFQPGTELAREIKGFMQRTVAPYKTPRLIEFVASLPKTTSGKIRRKELRRHAAENPLVSEADQEPMSAAEGRRTPSS